jgi:hypothetical protein
VLSVGPKAIVRPILMIWPDGIFIMGGNLGSYDTRKKAHTFNRLKIITDKSGILQAASHL